MIENNVWIYIYVEVELRCFVTVIIYLIVFIIIYIIKYYFKMVSIYGSQFKLVLDFNIIKYTNSIHHVISAPADSN